MFWTELCLSYFNAIFTLSQNTQSWRLYLEVLLEQPDTVKCFFSFSFTKGQCPVWGKQQLSHLSWLGSKTRCVSNLHCSNASSFSEMFHWEKFQYKITCSTRHNHWDSRNRYRYFVGRCRWWWEWSGSFAAFVSVIKHISTHSVTDWNVTLGFVTNAGSIPSVTLNKVDSITRSICTFTISTNI